MAIQAPRTTSARKRIHLIGIDYQLDFCAPSAASGRAAKYGYNGRLYVDEAENDAERMADFIRAFGKNIELCHFTLDSHQRTHIADPSSWVGRDGKNPDWFTVITEQDGLTGVWRAADPSRQAWFMKYLGLLARPANGGPSRYELRIWPPHCIIGSRGHALVPSISEALEEWSVSKKRGVNYVAKGSNQDTEHYSAVKADVEIGGDPSTKLNARLIDLLAGTPTMPGPDEVLFSGEALTHCCANTGYDLQSAFGTAGVSKFVFFKDTMSPVLVAAPLGVKFLKDMEAAGAKVTTTKDYLA